MAQAEPRLRAVGPEGATAAPDAGAPGARRSVIALGIALALALVLLVWRRTQLSGRIETLRAQNAQLAETLAEREAVMSAQQRRLDQVRSHLRGVVDLLDEPLGVEEAR